MPLQSRLRLSYCLTFLFLSTLSFSCSYIFGRKSKSISIYIESDSLQLITSKNQLINTSPVSMVVEMKDPKIEFEAVSKDSPYDTFQMSFKRRIKDVLYLESVLYFPWSLGYGYYMVYNEPHGRAFNYPDRLYVDISDRKKPISPFPRKRMGWTRLNAGFTFYNDVQIKGAEENYGLVSPSGLHAGIEYFITNNMALSNETGIFLGGDTRSGASYLTDTGNVFRLNYRYTNFIISRQIGRRFSIGLGLSLNQTRFRLERRDTTTATKTFVTLRRLEATGFSPTFKLNYWLKPNSSLHFAYTPIFGKNSGNVFQLGFTVNFHLFDPKRYRISFDDRMGGFFENSSP